MRSPPAALLWLVLLLPHVASAQDSTTAPAVRRSSKPPPTTIHAVYLHVGASFGLGGASSEVTELLNNEFGVGISTAAGLLARAGIWNVVQAEYRITDAAHTFLRKRVPNGQFQQITEIPMDYDVKDWVVKVNPLAPLIRRSRALFIGYGRGKVDWSDEDQDGFEGPSNIISVDYQVLGKGGDIGIGLTRSKVTFDRATLAGVTFPSQLTATQWTLSISFGVGIGR